MQDTPSKQGREEHGGTSQPMDATGAKAQRWEFQSWMQAPGRLASLAVEVCGYRTEKKRDQKLRFMLFVPKPIMLNNDCNKDDNDGGGGNGDPAGDPNE